MVVRVRIKVCLHSGDEVESKALVNTGAETDEPVIALPLELANKLNLRSYMDGEAVSIKELSSETIGYLMRNKVIVKLLDEHGNKLSEASSYVLIKPGVDEPIISDSLIEDLGIVIVKAKKGLWRHINDAENIVRESAR